MVAKNYSIAKNNKEFLFDHQNISYYIQNFANFYCNNDINNDNNDDKFYALVTRFFLSISTFAR